MGKYLVVLALWAHAACGRFGFDGASTRDASAGDAADAETDAQTAFAPISIPGIVGYSGMDSLGRVFLAGAFTGTVNFDPSGTDNHTSNGAEDIFISRFGSDGAYVGTVTFGGAGTEGILWRTKISFDATGSFYVAGTFVQTVNFDWTAATAPTTAVGANPNAFLVKGNSDGTFAWVRTWGAANGRLDITNVGVTGNNILLLAAITSTVDVDPTAGTVNKTSAGFTDIALVELNTAGAYVNGVAWTGSLTDGEMGGIATDSSGHIYVATSFKSTIDFDPGVGVQNFSTATANKSNCILVKLNSDLTYAWAKQFGGTNFDYCEGIGVDMAATASPAC